MIVTRNDIVWDTLRGMPDKIVARAEARSAHFPSRIGPFRRGRAEVCWQLNPDGRCYVDDGEPAPHIDEEINLYGIIDRRGQVVEPFRAIGEPREAAPANRDPRAPFGDSRRDLRSKPHNTGCRRNPERSKRLQVPFTPYFNRCRISKKRRMTAPLSCIESRSAWAKRA